MATGIYSWSQTAATNATADSTINWAEGQGPSTVNDSARALMAILSKWRDDISGVQPSNVVQTSGGTANAQTLATNTSIAALTNGWTLTFKAGNSNTSSCTLAVDGLTAKHIQMISGSNLNGGELRAGSVYTVTYHQPTDSWVLHTGPIMGPVKLTQASFSGSSAVNIVLTNYTAFRALKFYFVNVTASTTLDIYLRTSTDGGSNYDAGASDYGYAMHLSREDDTVMSVSADDTAAQIYAAFTAASTGDHANFEVTLWGQTGSLYTHATVIGAMSYLGDLYNVQVAGVRKSNADVDAVRFLPSTGTISGTYAVYGIP